MYEKKNDYIGVLVVLVVVIFCGWLYADSHRNDGISNNTDSTVAELNDRIKSLEQRLDTMSSRIEETQKAVNGIAVGITRSTGYAIEITEGVGRAEERLESAIGRSERIKGIIQDIERANK